MGICVGNTRRRPKSPVKQLGNIVFVNFRDQEGKNPRQISIYDENVLRKAIEIYQQQLNKPDSKIMKALYEPTKEKLSIETTIKDLGINLYSDIIVYLN